MSTPLTDIPGIGPAAATTLKKNGYKNAEDVASSSPEALSTVPGFGKVRAGQTFAAAIAILSINELSKPKTAKKKRAAAKPKKKKAKKEKKAKGKKEKKAKSKKKNKKKKKGKKKK